MHALRGNLPDPHRDRRDGDRRGIARADPGVLPPIGESTVSRPSGLLALARTSKASCTSAGGTLRTVTSAAIRAFERREREEGLVAERARVHRWTTWTPTSTSGSPGNEQRRNLNWPNCERLVRE